MRRSIWPFKKYPYDKRITLFFALFATTSLMSMGTNGCRVREDIQLPALLRPSSPLTFTSGQGNTKPNQLGSLQRSACQDGLQVWDIPFASAMGQHTLKMEMDTAKAQDNTRVTIDGAPYLLTLKPWISPASLHAGCDPERKGDDPVKLSDTDLNQYKQALNTAVPDCQWKWGEEGWICQLPKATPHTALQELKELETRMILKWSRHPYLLTRRIAVVVQLAGILSVEQPDRHLARFCKGLSFSLPLELPLALRSPTWQTRVCHNPNGQHLEAALVGLQQATAEVEALKFQMENNSRVGSLTIRIPANEVPSRDLWVSLDPVGDQPSAPVTLDPQGPAAVVEKPLMQNFVCWHPLYGADVGSTRIAHALDTLHKNQTCQPLTPTDAKQSTQAYIVSSITSEAEFPITNGRSKVLRLPEGQYRYTLRKHVPDFELLHTHPTAETTSGTLEWVSRRPNAIINKW